VTPLADSGALVTDFQLAVDNTNVALDQLFGEIDGQGANVWSQAWKWSPALVALVATSLVAWRRRQRSTAEAATDLGWFPNF